jgi:hypothetical protein
MDGAVEEKDVHAPLVSRHGEVMHLGTITGNPAFPRSLSFSGLL